MNCKNCGYGLKQSCGDFEKIICTYEEGECKKITELEAQIEKMKCCFNCSKGLNCSQDRECRNHEKWELKENEK